MIDREQATRAAMEVQYGDFGQIRHLSEDAAERIVDAILPLDESGPQWKVCFAVAYPDPVYFDDGDKAQAFHRQHGGELWYRRVEDWQIA